MLMAYFCNQQWSITHPEHCKFDRLVASALLRVSGVVSISFPCRWRTVRKILPPMRCKGRCQKNRSEFTKSTDPDSDSDLDLMHRQILPESGKSCCPQWQWRWNRPRHQCPQQLLVKVGPRRWGCSQLTNVCGSGSKFVQNAILGPDTAANFIKKDIFKKAVRKIRDM